MHQNSLDAFEKVKPTLNTKQTMVMAMLRGKTLTRQDLGFLLKWEINRVTPRVKELLDLDQIEEVGKRDGRALLRVKK